MKKLGELTELITKGTTPNKFIGQGIKFIKIECFDGDRINIEKCLFIDEKTHNKELKRSILKENDLLFAIAGATIGKINIVTSDILPANTNQALAIIRLDEKENSKFIYQILKSDIMQKYIKDSISVGAQPNLNLEQMNNFSFFYPSFLEQQKTASFLSLIDERISTQNKIIEQIETLIKGLYQEVFDNQKHQFSILPLKSLCSIKKGTQINASELSETGLYYVMNGGVLPSGYHSEYNSNGDIISISEGGNSCGYVQYNKIKFWSGGHCYTLNNIDNITTNRYLYYYLKANENKIMALRVGSGLPNIQKSTLEKFEIKIPRFSEQEKVVLALDSFSNKQFLERELLKKYQLQKKHLLQNLFI